jgi:murein DD-endopeptidase MepM/ murein hydrolase activator NlpD
MAVHRRHRGRPSSSSPARPDGIAAERQARLAGRSSVTLIAVLVALVLGPGPSIGRVLPAGSLGGQRPVDQASLQIGGRPSPSPARVSGLPLGELSSLVREADRRVAEQEVTVEQANRRLAVTEVDLDRLTARRDEVRARIDGLRADVADQAVSLYISPREQLLDQLTTTGDLNTAARRLALTETVVNRRDDAVDRLRAAKRDLDEVDAAVRQAADRMTSLARDAAGAQAGLDATAGRRVALAETLARRVAALADEVDEHERAEPLVLRILTDADLAAPPDGQVPAAEGSAAVGSGPMAVRALAPAGASSGADGGSGAGGRTPEAGAAGEEREAALVSPAPGLAVTSPFGARWGRMHRGVDFEADEGTPVSSAGAGTVIFAGETDGFGLNVIVDHGGALSTLYAHLSAIEVAVGERVVAASAIGAIGTTGNATGPHLHFEVREAGVAHDPTDYLP